MGGVVGEGGGVSSEWESLPAQQLIGLLRVQAEQIRVLTAQITAQSEQMRARNCQDLWIGDSCGVSVTS